MAVVRLWGFILNAMGRTEGVQSRRVTCYDLHLLKQEEHSSCHVDKSLGRR